MKYKRVPIVNFIILILMQLMILIVFVGKYNRLLTKAV
jgi:hypothetical protein